MTPTELLALILLGGIAARFIFAALVPGVIDWLNERVPFIPDSGQPVHTWRRLHRVWFSALVLVAVMELATRGASEVFWFIVALLVLTGWCGFAPSAARRHARHLQARAPGRCGWCGQFFGRARPLACPACARQMPLAPTPTSQEHPPILPRALPPSQPKKCRTTTPEGDPSCVHSSPS
jgi:hypothetical protein